MYSNFNSPSEYYISRETENTILLKTLRKKSAFIAIIRLVLFIGGVALCVFLGFNTTPTITALAVLLSIATMLITVKWHQKIQVQIAITQSVININQNELACLNFNFSGLPDGKEAVDYQHPFSSDLDIFGENSIFQYINRTVTPFGFKQLVLCFKHLELNTSTISHNQQCINELASKPNWRQLFIAEGVQLALDEQQVNRLFDWFNSKNKFVNKLYIKYLIVILPVLTSLLLAYGIFSGVYSLFTMFALVQIFIIMLNTKEINKVHDNVSQMHRILQSYSTLFSLIETEQFKTEKLQLLQHQLISEKQGAAMQLQKLSGILNAFDTRLNILAAIPLNTLVLFDLHTVTRLERWKENNLTNSKIWFETLGEFERLISLSNYAFNNPENCYPALSVESYTFKATDLGHPLIPAANRVTNNFSLSNKGSLAILTGANMAGKSTFLRTVGINMVLGTTGAPVCATSLEFCPIQIRTSINVRDSLKGNESYFYAELQRLKSIIDTLLSGEKIFIILDEILKGTNSNDKLKGSFALLKRLKDMNVSGIIATHDISLSELEQQFPENFKNYCFEVSLDNDFLFYDYKLNNGVCKNLNALLLMKKMGIVN